MGVFLWVLLRTISNMSLDVGTDGISFHVSCIVGEDVVKNEMELR